MRRIRRVNLRQAFSLIELLVVLLIIVILMSILVPVARRARRSAKDVVCSSNLRQIGQAILTYKSDYRQMPVAAVMPAPFAYPGAPIMPMYDALAGYVSPDSGIYRCPNDDGIVFDRCAAASPMRRGISYLYSYWPPDAIPKSPAARNNRNMVMWDYNGDSLHGVLHRRGGGCTLYRDGSVEFKPGAD